MPGKSLVAEHGFMSMKYGHQMSAINPPKQINQSGRFVQTHMNFVKVATV